MGRKPIYEGFEKRVKALERQAVELPILDASGIVTGYRDNGGDITKRV